jgi:hypothetical protein
MGAALIPVQISRFDCSFQLLETAGWFFYDGSVCVLAATKD